MGLDDRTIPAIYGTTEGKPITLLDSFTLMSRGGFFSGRPEFHHLHVQRALVGSHVPSSDATVFRSAYLRFENLTMWAQLRNVDRDTDWKNGVARASLSRGDSVVAVFDGWTYSLQTATTGFSYEQTRERTEVSGDVTTVLKLTPPAPSSVAAFDAPILEVMDLLTLASGTACGLISATFVHQDAEIIERRDQAPIEHPTHVGSFGQRVHRAAPDAPATKYQDFRFTCADLDFPSVLANWLPLRRQASDAANVYFGTKYSTPGFTEVRLLLGAVAAEALHAAAYEKVRELDPEEFEDRRDRLLAALDTEDEKTWLKRKLRNDPTLRERLLSLASVPDQQAVNRVVPDVDRWAGELLKARNGMAHSAGRGLGPEIFDLEWATSGLIALVFMQELGLSADVQRRAADHNLALDR